MASPGAQDKVNEFQKRGETVVDTAKTKVDAAVGEASPSIHDAKDHAAETVAQLKDGASVGSGTIQAQAADVAGQAADFAKGALNAAKDHAQGLADKAQSAAGQLRDQLPDTDDLRAAGQRGSDSLARQVARQPFEALLLAGAIGYLAAWIIHRR